jgi:YHS domain-containing protein
MLKRVEYLEKKKQKKRPTKTKPKVIKESGNPVSIPDPIVIETKGDPTQDNNPLNKKRPEGFSSKADLKGPNYGLFEETKGLPEGFKTADAINPMDDLLFEMKKLQNKFAMWNYKLQFKGKEYYFMVDPLNCTVEMFDNDPTQPK